MDRGVERPTHKSRKVSETPLAIGLQAKDLPSKQLERASGGHSLEVNKSVSREARAIPLRLTQERTVIVAYKPIKQQPQCCKHTQGYLSICAENAKCALNVLSSSLLDPGAAITTS